MAEILLINAARLGELEEVRRLLGEGIDVNEEDWNGDTALNCVAIHGHLEIACLLIEYGARINHQNKGGWTALIYASANNHPSIVSLLFEKGAEINIKNRIGYTPLIISTLFGHLGIVSLLLRKGADPYVLNKQGKSALDIARGTNYSDCIGILENYEHFHRYRVTWLSFSTSLRSFQEDNQNQELKQNQSQTHSPSLMKMMDSSDLVRFITEFM